MGSRLRGRTPPQEAGGEGWDRSSQHPSGPVPAAPLPIALPLDLAALLLCRSGAGIPRDRLAENRDSFPLCSPGLARQVKSENKALDAPACSTVSHEQNSSDQLLNKSLQRDWREPGSERGVWKSLPISRKSN